MSSAIFYDKAFIKVPGGYIPIVNCGFSNCFEFDWNGHEVPEKNWIVLNYPAYGKMVFTAEEMQKVAETYEEINTDNLGGNKKSRNRAFEKGEFGRWILAGMKTAHTVEKYWEYGNSVILIDRSEEKWKRIFLHSTDELMEKLKEYDGRKDFTIGFDDNRHVTHPVMRSKSKPFDYSRAAAFYVLYSTTKGYFVKRSSKRIWTVQSASPHARNIRKFRTEKEAYRYLEDNQAFFSKCAFLVERVLKEGCTNEGNKHSLGC